MKLISCHIENFGKLSNQEFDFSQITCINEKNGFGKTTLAVFIKSMLYGLEYKRRKELYDRTRYLPWNNGKYGGYLIFQINNKTYRIERTFGKTAKGDSFKLFDQDTNIESHDYSENIGEEIFEVDRESFENTAFISLGKNNNLLTEIISSKLNDEVDTQNMDDYQKTYNLLDKKATELYAKRGNKGVVPEKIEQLNTYKRKLLECNQSEKEIERLKNEIEIKDQNIAQLQKQAYNTKPKKTNNNEPQINYINTLIDKYNDSCQLDAKINNLEFKRETIKQTIKNHNSEIEKKAKFNKTMFMLNFVLLVLGIASMFFNFVVGICVVVVFAIIFGLSFGNLKKLKADIKQEDFTDIDNEIENLKSQKDILDDEYKAFIIKHNKNDDLQNIIKSLTEIKEKLQSEDEFSQEENIEILNKLSKLKADKLLLKNRIDSLGESLQQKESVECEIENLSEEIDTLNEKYEILKDTMKYLEIAKQNLASKYIGGVKEGFEKYLSKLDINDLSKYKIDINLDVKIEEQGQLYQSDYLSLGSLDLVNICTRMALVEAVYKQQEKPILILDDPFANLDDEKLKDAINLVKEISKEYQIIYFTCNKSREITVS